MFSVQQSAARAHSLLRNSSHAAGEELPESAPDAPASDEPVPAAPALPDEVPLAEPQPTAHTAALTHHFHIVGAYAARAAL